MNAFVAVIGVLFQLCTYTNAGNGGRIEATGGDNVTLFFLVDKAEEIDNVKIFFIAEGKEKVLIVNFICYRGNCTVEEDSGVSLQVKGNVSVTIQNVQKSRNAGVYEGRLIGKKVFYKSLTLIVNEPPQATSSLPGKISSPEAPDTDKDHWPVALILLGLFITRMLIFGVLCILNKYMKNQDPLADDVENAG